MDMNLIAALVVAAVLVIALVARSTFWAEIVVTAQLTKLVHEGALKGGDAALMWSVMMRWHLKGRSVWVTPERLAEASKVVGADFAEILGPRTVQALQLAGDRYWEKHRKLMPEEAMNPIIEESWRRYPEERPLE